MPKYVVLLNWTDQGIKGVRETTQRSDRARQLFEQAGGTVDIVLWTQGRYDIVLVVDVPDDESLAAVLLQLGMVGAVRTESLRGFTQEEMQGLLQRIG